MTHTYDIATSRGKVRLLARDTNSDMHLFEDDEIDAFLGLCSSEVLLAAAMALETVAANEVLVQKRISLLGDLETDGPAEAASLKSLAKSLREQWHLCGADGGYFGWAEFADDSLQAVEYVIKDAMRNG